MRAIWKNRPVMLPAWKAKIGISVTSKAVIVADENSRSRVFCLALTNPVVFILPLRSPCGFHVDNDVRNSLRSRLFLKSRNPYL